MDDNLETRRVRYFMQVLDSGSVRGAAGALDMDASAVSRAVSILLESECGTSLIERRGRGVAPTDAGSTAGGLPRRQQSEKQNLLAQMDSIRKVESGHIDIMAGEGYVDWLMQQAAYRASCRRIRRSPSASTSASTDEIAQSIVEERAPHRRAVQADRRTSACARTTLTLQPIQTLVLGLAPAGATQASAAACRPAALSRRHDAPQLRRAPAHRSR